MYNANGHGGSTRFRAEVSKPKGLCPLEPQQRLAFAIQ